GGSGVDDVADAGNREARLGDVRCEDHPTADAGDATGLEDAMLLGGRQPTVERKYLGGGGVFRVGAADRVGGVLDLGLAGEEHQHIAALFSIECAQRRDDGRDLVGGVGGGILVFVIDQRAIADLN